MFKAIWYSVIDAWLTMKRFWSMGSGIWFETKPGALLVDVMHRGSRKTIRIATDRLDAALAYMDRQPHGAPVVFREGDHWTLVPDFLVADLRAYLVSACDALRRSQGQEPVATPEPSSPKVNTRPTSNTVN